MSEKSEPTLTRVFIFDKGEWLWLTDVDEIAYGIALIPQKGKRQRETVILGRTGTFVRSPRGASPVEEFLPESDTMWTDISATKNGVFSCGTNGALAVYEKGTWKFISPPLSHKKGDWNGVATSSDDSIMVCGDKGSVYVLNDTHWTDISIKENFSLSAICASNKDRTIVGSDGYIWIQTKGSSWQKIKLPTNDTVESLLDTPLGIFALTRENLFEIKEGEVTSVLSSKEQAVDFVDCDYVDGVLWICGEGYVISFDGKKVEKFLCPENKK